MATINQKIKTKEFINKYDKYKGTFLYLVKCHKFYKIGVSWSLSERLNSLQCGNPYELELVFAIKTRDAEESEELLHEHFKEKRVFREWFELNDEDIKFILELAD